MTQSVEPKLAPKLFFCQQAVNHIQIVLPSHTEALANVAVAYLQKKRTTVIQFYIYLKI